MVWFDFYQENELHENSSIRERIIIYLRTIGFKICILTLALATASLSTNFILNSDKFFEYAINIAHAASLIIIGLKAFVCYWYKNEFLEIFQELTVIFTTHQQETEKHKINSCLQDYHRIIKFYAGFFLTSPVPIVLNIIPYLVNRTVTITVNYWFPFNPYEDGNFFFAWLWMNWVAWMILFSLLGSDSLLYGLITVIAMEFDLLQDNLELINSMSKHERKLKVKHLIDRHNKLLDITEKLKNIYSSIFLFIFVITSMILCLVLFQLSTGPSIFDSLFLVSYVAIMGGEVLILCYFGQKLLDSSESIADGIYNCNWEYLDENSCKIDLIPIIVRAQKAKRLTAMNFADISLESFTSVSLFCKSLNCHFLQLIKIFYLKFQIITATISYFTLLNNVYDKK